MSVASLNNGQLQLSELTVSNEKYSNATGYLPFTSTFTANLDNISLDTDRIKASSLLTLGDNSNSAVSTYNQTSLTFTRNISAGQNEFDIVAINPTSSTFLNIYGSQTSVVGGTTEPLVSITATDVDINGTCNAEAFGITNGSLSVSLQCVAADTLSVGGNVQCSSVGTPALALQSGLNGGLLTTNSSNQLLWNGVVIS